MKTSEDLTEALEPAEPASVPRRGWAYALGAIATAVALVVALVLVLDGRDDGAGEDLTPTTAAATTAPPTSAPSVDRTTAVWPFAGSDVRPEDPVEAAQRFAVDFLGFTAPVVGEFQQGDSRSGEVEVKPVATGPVTTVMVRQLTGENTWSVLGAATANIEVTEPAAGDTIASPVHVTGRALAFEGVVQVEVRQDGEFGAIGEGTVVGGGDAVREFAGDVSFETPGAPYGALVFFTRSAEGRDVWEAAVMRVRLVSTDIDAATCGDYAAPRLEPATGQMEVKVYFNCDVGGTGEVALVPVYRLVSRSPDVLRASLEALLAGPDAEEQRADIGSWFSADTAGMLRSVTVEDGHAIVDFDDLRPVISSASSSAGSALLLSQLNATVFQLRRVESVEYRLNGDCEAFNEWLQYAGCDPRTRPASPD